MTAEAKRGVYLDHNATTPVRPEVREAMLPFLEGRCGNPNSVHAFGQEARRAVEEARERVAALIGAASPDEIVFTSGGCESDTFAVCGGARYVRVRTSGAKRHVVTTEIEHEAIHGACRMLLVEGFEVTKVFPDENARIEPRAVAGALRPETALASIMLANNEVGTIQPVAEIAALCRERGVLSHTDAVQAVGKIPVDVKGLGVDLLSLSGHKMNAPKGIGALYIREGVELSQLIAGTQEKRRRGGTENVASIVGLGTAASLLRGESEAHARELRSLRDRLENGVVRLPGIRWTVGGAESLPGTAHFCCEGVDGHHLVVTLDLEGFCVSSGPACAGGMTELSHVLKAMKIRPEVGRGALRVSLGWGSTRTDVDAFLEALPRVLNKLRSVE